MTNILKNQLTEKQAEVLDYYEKFQEKKKYSPALSKVAGHFNRSVPTIHQHVDYLERKGYLVKEKGVRNSIRILKSMRDIASIVTLEEIKPKIQNSKKMNWKNWINTIQCMDCVLGLDYIPDESVDLVITDPPYGISKELNCKGKRLGTTAKLNFNFGEWDKFNMDWFEIAIKKTRGWMMTFCAKKDVGYFIDILEKSGFVAVDVIVWQKPDPVPLNAKSRFLNAWEAIVVGKRPGTQWNSNYEHNIIKMQAPKGKNRIHPTQKPVELIKKLINLTTKEGDLILDPFMGSGTTAVACIESKRNYLGFEISREYCKQSNERIGKTVTSLF